MNLLTVKMMMYTEKELSQDQRDDIVGIVKDFFKIDEVLNLENKVFYITIEKPASDKEVHQKTDELSDILLTAGYEVEYFFHIPIGDGT